MKNKDKKMEIAGAVETAEETMDAAEAAEAGTLKDVCGRKECFSYQDGHCQCLSDTDFGGRACPFFKTVKQYERDLAAHPVKDRSGGEEDDFLSANEALIKELSDMEAEAERIEKEGYVATDSEDDGDDWDDEESDDADGADEADEVDEVEESDDAESDGGDSYEDG